MCHNVSVFVHASTGEAMSDDAPLPKDGDVQFASTAASAVASWMPVSGADDKDADAPVQRIAPRTGLGATRGRAKVRCCPPVFD